MSRIPCYTGLRGGEPSTTYGLKMHGLLTPDTTSLVTAHLCHKSILYLLPGSLGWLLLCAPAFPRATSGYWKTHTPNKAETFKKLQFSQDRHNSLVDVVDLRMLLPKRGALQLSTSSEVFLHHSVALALMNFLLLQRYGRNALRQTLPPLPLPKKPQQQQPQTKTAPLLGWHPSLLVIIQIKTFVNQSLPDRRGVGSSANSKSQQQGQPTQSTGASLLR